MRDISKSWLLAAALFVLVIWGNSLVPGTGSSSLSLMVVDAVRSVLDALSLPSAWVTNFLVRKAAHFSEYLLLGVLVTRGFDRRYAAHPQALFAIAVALVAVPSIDETIQLFVSGRSGQVTDVLIDCTGAATGVLISYAIAGIARRASS